MVAKLVFIPLTAIAPSKLLVKQAQAELSDLIDKALLEYCNLLADGYTVQHSTVLSSDEGDTWVFLMSKPDDYRIGYDDPSIDQSNDSKSTYDDDIPF